MKRLLPLLSITAMTVLSHGCNWLVPFAFIGQHKKTVAPEFARLPGHRVAVLVWAESDVLFDYPHLRLEVSTYIGEKLKAELTGKKVDNPMVLIEPRRVESYLEQAVTTTVSPEEVGKEVNAEIVVYVEILKFSMRDVEMTSHLKGRVEAAVAVYDLTTDPDEPNQYDLNPVKFEFPETNPVPLNPTNSLRVRQGTYEKLAELVARKFHEYQEEL